MDAMRGILMILGLVYHAGKTFSPMQDWLIRTDLTTPIAHILVEFIHIFRMPTFFIVSGYFAALTLKRYGSSKFLKVRVTRIVIPLLVTALTLNSIQAYILTQNGLLDFDLYHYITNGQWVTHLWFLINLIIYFTIAAILVAILKDRLYKIMQIIDKALLKIPFSLILLFILPSIIIGSMAFSQAIPIRAIVNTSLLFNYMPFFFFGMLLFSSDKLLDKFTNFSPITSAIIIIITLFIINYLYNYEGFKWFVVRMYFVSVGMWFSASLCFYLFKKFTDYHSKTFMFLSEISYSVYLFHHVLTIGFGLILIKCGVGGLLGMLLLMISTATISILIHMELISRFNFLSILFNGKPIKKT
jgi:glucan biosynthesis protein C